MGKMKRELLKKILSITKEEGGIADPSKENVGFVGIYNRGIEGFSDQEISDHVEFLYQEGFIEARSDKTLDGVKWYPEKIIQDFDD